MSDFGQKSEVYLAYANEAYNSMHGRAVNKISQVYEVKDNMTTFWRANG